MKKRSNLSIMFRLSALVKPLAGFMVLAIIMGVIGNLCAAFITVLGGYAILDALNISTGLSMLTAFILAGVFALLRGILRYAEQSSNHYIAFKLLALIRDRVFVALRRLCPAKLEGKDKGNLISIITSDIELLEVFYAHTISPIAIAIIFCIIMVVFISMYSVILGMIALAAYVTVGVIIPIAVSKISGNNGEKFRKKSGELSTFVLDSLHGISELIQFGSGKKRCDELSKKTEDLLKTEKAMKQKTGTNMAVTNTVIFAFDIILLITAAFLYQSGTVGFDGVIIPVIALMSSFGPVVALANLGSTLQNTFAAGNRVLNILDESPVVEEISGKKDVAFTGAKAENVSFAYGDEIILNDVSADIKENSVVGIIGKSGSGKSTLLKLLMRFWQIQKGDIKISDTSIEDINTSNLRDIESYVTQDTHLFHDSIKNNLKIAKLDATDDEIISACKKASVHDFIMSLPNGYDTMVGELGDTLSGGEKQRLGLARAFLHNAPLMLLDEPTSNLDSLNEAVILKSLNEERDNKTVVLVSHRESTMKIADTVYCVENGRTS